jgi:DNA-binding transcriptional LysR family regulator
LFGGRQQAHHHRLFLGNAMTDGGVKRLAWGKDMGLAQVPGPIVAGPVKAGKLVHVLEPFAPVAPGVFLYYPSRHQMVPKLRAFIDYVKSRSDATNKTRIRRDDRRTRDVKTH